MQNQPITQEARLHFLDYWRVVKSRWMFVTLIFLLVVLVAAVVTYFQPKLYTASARISVQPERPVVDAFNRSNLPSYDPFFLQTQYEIIQSQNILYPVIERLNLTEAWQLPTRDLAFLRLKGSLSVRRFRDTSLIAISVTLDNPRLAADIANTIAEVFERERLEVKRQETQKGIAKLREELESQSERVRLAQTEVERLRRELNVPVFGDVKLTDLTIRQLEQQLNVARAEASAQEARLKELRKLNPTQLRNAVATVITDSAVQTLVQELSRSELQFELLKQDFGPDHPNVRAELATLAKLNEQIDARLEGMMRGFEVEYEVAASRVAEFETQLHEAKQTGMALEGETFLPFRNAQRAEESEIRLYEALKQRVQQESVEMELPRSPVEVHDRAEVPRFAVKPNMKMNLLVGAAAGLVLGLTLAFFIEFLDTSVKQIEDVERFLGLPVLGVIPQNAGNAVRGEATAADIEAYRMLRTNLEFAERQNPVRSLCVVSAAPGEGKSFTVANLACICAQHGARVLVVDGDLRRPRLHDAFGIENNAGLADYLMGETTLAAALVPTSVPNVMAITAGAGRHAKHALPLLGSARMLELMRAVEKEFDLVIYDTPPVLGVSESATLVRDAGAAFLVIQHRRYPRQMARRAQQMLDNAGARLLGVVINNVAISQTETYYYYHQQYEDYLKGPDRRANEPAAKPRAAAGPAKPRATENDQIQLTGKY